MGNGLRNTLAGKIFLYIGNIFRLLGNSYKKLIILLFGYTYLLIFVTQIR